MDTKNANDLFSPSKENILVKRIADLEHQVAKLEAELADQNAKIWKELASFRKDFCKHVERLYH